MHSFTPTPMGPMYAAAEGAGLNCNITKVENGYVVTVNAPYPTSFGTAEIPAQLDEDFLNGMVDASIEIQKAAGGAAVRGVDEEIDAWKKDDGEREEKSEAARKKAKENITKAVKSAKAKIEKKNAVVEIFKPTSIYVFGTLLEALSFINVRMEPPKK